MLCGSIVRGLTVLSTRFLDVIPRFRLEPDKLGPVQEYALSQAPSNGAVNPLDQFQPVEGLGQEAYRSGLKRSRFSSLLRESGDEYDRCEATLSAQEPLELEAGHAWHLNVRDYARRINHVRRSQEIFGRRERMGSISQRPHESVGRVADGSVIVDD
jgi:hypothetical protein